MYEDLVKAIRQNACHFDACGMCPKRNALCMDRMALQAADAIEELSHDYEKPAEDFNGAVELLHKRSKPRWIPVTERLPEPFENILVANKRGKHYDIDKGWWNGTFFDRCAKGGYHNVTHWMPLPEPPKEE